MSDWLVLSQTCTSSGSAREFAVGLMDGPERCHAIAAERQGGGGDDSRVPRRAIGIGADRLSARRSLEETITTYDPAGRVVFSR
jgi:hypothetical protein